MNSTQLLEEFIGGESHDWTAYSWDVDFGEGYQFILVQINAETLVRLMAIELPLTMSLLEMPIIPLR